MNYAETAVFVLTAVSALNFFIMLNIRNFVIQLVTPFNSEVYDDVAVVPINEHCKDYPPRVVRCAESYVANGFVDFSWINVGAVSSILVKKRAKCFIIVEAFGIFKEQFTTNLKAVWHWSVLKTLRLVFESPDVYRAAGLDVSSVRLSMYIPNSVLSFDLYGLSGRANLTFRIIGDNIYIYF